MYKYKFLYLHFVKGKESLEKLSQSRWTGNDESKKKKVKSGSREAKKRFSRFFFCCQKNLFSIELNC
jgi:hypothetical protein